MRVLLIHFVSIKLCLAPDCIYTNSLIKVPSYGIMSFYIIEKVKKASPTQHTGQDTQTKNDKIEHYLIIF